MEITKEKLISLVNENYISDLEEDDLLKKRERALEKIKKRFPIRDNNGIQIGWMWRTNIEDLTSKLVTVYFVCGEELEEFKNKHKDTIERIDQLIQGWYFSEESCPADYPERKKTRVYKDPEGNVVDPFISRGHKSTKSYMVIVNGEVVFQIENTKPNAEEIANEFADEYRENNPNANIEVKLGNTTTLTQKNIKLIINPILDEYFSIEGKINNLLSVRSIPPIMVRNSKFLDRHVDKWNNQNIILRSATFNTYESGKEFLKYVVRRANGKKDDKTDPRHLAMQFNKKYKKWEEGRMSNVEYKGKTDDPDYIPPYQRKSSYKLDIQGYEELNMDVSLKMVFELIGEKIGDAGYVWTIKMVNKFGRKKPEDQFITDGLKTIELLPGGVLDGKAIISTKTVQLDPNITFNNKETILHNEKVVQGLIDTIEDFKNKVESIQTNDMIKLANVRRSDIERVNENKINKIIRSIILETMN
jgi:hypothetical protein